VGYSGKELEKNKSEELSNYYTKTIAGSQQTNSYYFLR